MDLFWSLRLSPWTNVPLGMYLLDSSQSFLKLIPLK